MNEFKGTPWPWRLHVDPAQKSVKTITGADHYGEEYVAVIGADSNVVCDNAQYYSIAVARADAQFIAQAPKLLALLQEARTTLEMWKDVAPAVSLCADIDKAIAKALGK